ncbi:DUF2993 domain-containing protein [Streptomyces sp. NPDC096040]|uniref:LmeA family phospholipid-binding protein n=1 Tax=Streptomyces sp. NPDC096040 TaxID=3155541 RepID=UPI00331BDFE7
MYRPKSDQDPKARPGHTNGLVRGPRDGDGTGRPRMSWARRRPVKIAAAFLIALPLVAVGIDRGVAWHMESKIADGFKSGMDTPKEPSVTISGFPVVTQAINGTLDHVHIAAHGIPADGSRPVPITELDVNLDDVKSSGDKSEAQADTADATALLSYSDLSDALGVQISQGTGAGRINVSVGLPMGIQVSLSMRVAATANNSIAFSDFRGSQGALPTPVENLLNQKFEEPLPLKNIPEGLHLQTISTTDKGIVAHLSGHTVTFKPGSSAA